MFGPDSDVVKVGVEARFLQPALAVGDEVGAVPMTGMMPMAAAAASARPNAPAGEAGRPEATACGGDESPAGDHGGILGGSPAGRRSDGRDGM